MIFMPPPMDLCFCKKGSSSMKYFLHFCTNLVWAGEGGYIIICSSYIYR